MVARLQARGLAVVVGPPGHPSGLSVRPRPLDINQDRARVHVFEYSTTDALEADAATISPDGFRIGMSFVDWIASPHFYKNSRVIVNYLGCDTEMIALFGAVVGPQFAGGGPPPIFGDPCGP